MVQTSHETGGRFVDVACDCHLMIDDVQVENRISGVALKCTFSVLGSTDYSQVGKTVSDYFACDGKGSGMALNLAEAAGLVTAQQREEARKAGIGLSFDEALLKGRQICAKIHLERKQIKNSATGKYEDDPDDPRSFAKIGFETFGIWSTKAAAIPKDMQFAGLVAKPAVPTGQTAAQPGLAPSRPAAPPAPAQQPLPLTGIPNAPAVDMKW